VKLIRDILDSVTVTTHQQKQIEVIDSIERQVLNNSLNFSTIAPVEDFQKDPRICLTSVHFPKQELLSKIIETIIAPLKIIEPSYQYYSPNSLHMTIKNIRVINDPPHFTESDVIKAEKIFSEVIPHHKKFTVYFYRLLLFPNNLALMGTTDPELDEIIFDLKNKLKDAGIPDDKVYTNSKYFFSNMTLARFTDSSQNFKNAVKKISETIAFTPYKVDSVSLISCNALMTNKNIIASWKLGYI
jgi:2'-5' RNA ligase